jgi:hypothetical protein
LHAEAIPLAELEELALLHGQSDGLLLRQARWHVLLHGDRLLLGLLFLRRQWCSRQMLLRADGRVIVVLVVAEEARAVPQTRLVLGLILPLRVHGEGWFLSQILR